MLQTKVVEKLKTCFIFVKLFFNKLPIYETVWKNIVERGRPQATIWCMHIARYLRLHIHIQNM